MKYHLTFNEAPYMGLLLSSDLSWGKLYFKTM